MSLLPAIRARLTIERRFDNFFLRLFVYTFVASVYAKSMIANSALALTHGFDDHYFVAHELSARISILRFLEAPLWNPFYCGGVVELANPQDVSTAPDFVLRLLFGVAAGRKLAVLLFLFIGMEGMYRLARRHGSGIVGALTAGVCFSTFEWFSNAVFAGWINMCAFSLLPFAVYFFERGFDRRRWLWGSAVAIAWMLAAGGTYSVPFTVLALAFVALYEVIVRAWQGRPFRRIFSPALALVLVGVYSVLLGAMRLLPLFGTVVGNPRLVGEHPSQTLVKAFNVLMIPDAGMYVGSLFVFVAIVGVLFRDRALNRALILAAVFFSLTLGELEPTAPYMFLKRLPIYSQLRAPDRYDIVVVLFLGLAGARAITLAGDVLATIVARLLMSFLGAIRRYQRLGKPARTALVFVPVALTICVSILAGFRVAGPTVAHNHFADQLFAFDGPERVAREFHQGRGNRWDAHVFPEANRGSLQCFEETKFAQSPLLRGDLEHETYLLEDEAGHIEELGWTPHSIRFRAQLARPATVLVNQNFAPQFGANVGTVHSHDGLLAVDLPAGTSEVTLRYRDWKFIFGAIVTFATIAFLLRRPLAWTRDWFKR